MKHLARVAIATGLLLSPFEFAAAQSAAPPSITTPDRVETRIGTLEFKDGAPSKATVDEGLRQPRLHARARRVR